MKDIPTKAAVTGDVVQLMNQAGTRPFSFSAAGTMRSGSIYGRLRRASHRLRSPELEPGVEFGAWSPWSSFWRGLIWHNAGSTRGRTGRRLCRSEEESDHLRGAFLRHMHSDHRLRHRCATTTDYPFHYRCGARGRDAERNRSDI